MTLRVIIADDEALARERLRTLLSKEPEVEIVAECQNGGEALRCIEKSSPDLVFLDISMPELDGFDVLRNLGRGKPPAVVFVTAHDRFAVRAFEVCAVDYLLKPFDEERFKEALRKGRETVLNRRDRGAMHRLAELVETLNARKAGERCLIVRSAGRINLVRPAEIDWIRGADNYAELHVGQEVHLLRETLASLQEQLPRGEFARIGRSLLVNVGRVRELRPKTHGDYLVILEDGTKLTASRTFRDEIRQLLNGQPS